MSTFEFGRVTGVPTVLLSAVVIVRAARIGVIADDDSLIVRNQWRTHRIQWRDIEKHLLEDIIAVGNAIRVPQDRREATARSDFLKRRAEPA